MMVVPAVSSVSVKQSGSVLFVILVMVVLVAAISYFLNQDDKNPRPNHDKSAISSTSVIQYAGSMTKGINRLLANHKTIDQIQFFAPIDPDFTALAESDQADSLLFHPEGGGVTYYPVDRDAVEKVTRTVNKTRNGNWHFMRLRIKKIGTREKELVTVLYRVKPNVCEKINEELVGDKTIPLLQATGEKFIKGKYRLDGPGIDGVPSLCIRTTDDRYIFYSVLLAQ